MKLLKHRKGLTLIELLIVIIILGALAAIAIPRMSQSSTTAKLRACQANIATMNTQIELYYSENDKWPTATTMTEVVDDINYFPDGPPVCPADGNYTMLSTHRVNCDFATH